MANQKLGTLKGSSCWIRGRDDSVRETAVVNGVENVPNTCSTVRRRRSSPGIGASP